jgi:hypothetical protein
VWLLYELLFGINISPPSSVASPDDCILGIGFLRQGIRNELKRYENFEERKFST